MTRFVRVLLGAAALGLVLGCGDDQTGDKNSGGQPAVAPGKGDAPGKAPTPPPLPPPPPVPGQGGK